MADQPTLNCTVSDERIRVLQAGVHMLQRVSGELTLEVATDATGTASVVLRALNDSKSTFAAVHFEQDFFSDFSMAAAPAPPPPASQSGAAPVPAPRTTALFSAKALANALRVLRGVSQCQLYFATEGARHCFVVVLRHRGGAVTRTHSLSYADADALQAVFDPSACRNKLIGPPALLDRLVGRIRGTDEASLLVLNGCVQLQGFHESGVESTVRGAVHTSVALEITAFDKYTIADVSVPSQAGSGSQPLLPAPVPVNVTFSVRELKHLLGFAMAMGVASEELAVFFDAPGAPAMFSTQGVIKRSFFAEIVCATLESDALPAPGSPLAQQLSKIESRG